MSEYPSADAIRGATMRWAWTEGPTRGKVHEHVFHEDGTVEWHDPGAASSPNAERVPFAAFQVTSDVYAVSYLAKSGFTLTVVLDYATRQLVGFASSNNAWYPLRGTFEVST